MDLNIDPDNKQVFYICGSNFPLIRMRQGHLAQCQGPGQVRQLWVQDSL